MKVGFDLDGCLDVPAIASLAKALILDGQTVYIITGVFSEAGDWQHALAKHAKLNRIGIPFGDEPVPFRQAGLHILTAVDVSFGRDYRLADLGLRKGELCERLGIEIFIDDSSIYCDMIPKMAGAITVLQVR